MNGARVDQGAEADFDRDVRPILSDKCFHCHGPDAATREADLRLDMRAGAVEGAIVPGDPDASELIARISSDDESMRMPPPETGLSLSKRQQELLREWIASGAEYKEHWAYRPLPATVDVPHVAGAEQTRNEIDRFVLSRLKAEGLQPAPRAEPLRILRRMTLDLTGLPPTIEEMDRFETEAAENIDAAIAAAANRLLASQTYGEHLAVAWLDAARYADSYGYQSDQLNPQWPYRDWVVRAFNDNLPYDEFLAWQLAGDLLENPSRDQILATAFNRLHRLTNEGGSIAEEWLAENAADRVHTFGAAMLGLTLECARCHDHKYDPILTRDYYSLAAFFNSIDENGMYDHAAKTPSPSLLLPTEQQEHSLLKARQAVEQAESERLQVIREGEKRFQRWIEKSRSRANAAPQDLVGRFTFDGDLSLIPNEATGQSASGSANGLSSVVGRRGQAVRLDGDRGVVFPDLLKIDRWDSFTVDLWLRDNARHPLPVVVVHRSYGTDVGYNGFDVLLADGVLEARFYRVWPGNGVGVRADEPIAPGQWEHVTVAYDGSSRAAGMRIYLNGRELSTTMLRDRMHKSASVATYGAGHVTLGERFRDRGFKEGAIDELRLFNRALTPLEVERLHAADAGDASPAVQDVNLERQREEYFSAYDKQARLSSERLREARRALVAAEDAIHEVSVMEELPEPRPTHILPRGAYDAPKTEENRVERDVFQEMLPPFPSDAPRNRLGLAQWLTAPDHPLTARVFVNRLWANFFGRGLVVTADNFGRQAAAPTHPELLDWLARDFVAHGWDVKRLCRQIVLSATYQQDSRCTAQWRQQDPENTLLARGPNRRLSAEQIRDLALAASELLVTDIGGPPVSPYQPGVDLWRESNGMSPPYQQSTGKGLHRRSLYSVWKRTAPLPNMLIFDAPSREVCAISRGRTNTPLQALVLLNDVQFVEAARTLAALVAKRQPNETERIGEAFRRLTSRHADPKELKLLTELYRQQQAWFGDHEQDAKKIVSHGEAQVDESTSVVDLAALTVVCQAILNLDAVIFER